MSDRDETVIDSEIGSLQAGLAKISETHAESKTLIQLLQARAGEKAELEEQSGECTAETAKRVKRCEDMKDKFTRITHTLVKLLPKIQSNLMSKERALGNVMSLHFHAKLLMEARGCCGKLHFPKKIQEQMKETMKQLKTDYVEPFESKMFDDIENSIKTLRDEIEVEQKFIEQEIKELNATNEQQRLTQAEATEKKEELEVLSSGLRQISKFVAASLAVVAVACLSPAVACLVVVKWQGVIASGALMGATVAALEANKIGLSMSKNKEELKAQIRTLEGLKNEQQINEATSRRLKNTIAHVGKFKVALQQAQSDTIALRTVLKDLDTEKGNLNSKMHTGVHGNIVELFAEETTGRLVYQQIKLICDAKLRCQELKTSGLEELGRAIKMGPADTILGRGAFLNMPAHLAAHPCMKGLGSWAASLCGPARSFTFVNASPFEVRFCVADDKDALTVSKMVKMGVTVEKRGDSSQGQSNSIHTLRPGQTEVIERKTNTVFVNAGVQHWAVFTRHEYYHLFWERKMLSWSASGKVVITEDVAQYNRSQTLKTDIYADSEEWKSDDIVAKKGI